MGDYVLITGPISTYKGQQQIAPTAYALIASDHALPAAVAVTGQRRRRGEHVGAVPRSPGEALRDADRDQPHAGGALQHHCGTPTADGGPLCSGCAPPTYSGFQVSDSASNVIYVEQYLFPGDPLQSSPECLTQTGQAARHAR